MHLQRSGSSSLIQFYLPWFLLLLASYFIYEVYQVEVRPEEYAVSHSKKIDTNSVVFFNFVTQTHILQKLLPWFSGLREADSRVLAVGKFYKTFAKIIIDREKIHLMVVDFRSGKYLTLQSVDQSIRQRIEIRTKCYHNQTILSTTVYSQRTSLLFHHTIGYVLQHFIQQKLKKSLHHVAEMYKTIENELQILRS